MIIIAKINFTEKASSTTEHITERSNRIRVYTETFGEGNTIASFVVDKGHRNGYEVHVLKDNRLIYIYNENSRKLITVLYARDAQISRYFKNTPWHLFDKYQAGYNEI